MKTSFQNQHCPLKDHAGQNNNSDITYENVTIYLGKIREGLRYNTMYPKYTLQNLQFLIALIFVPLRNIPVFKQLWEMFITKSQ